MNKVRLTLPASTSNLGPGFDTLGLALDLRLAASASKKGTGLEIRLSFPGPAQREQPLRELVEEAISAWEERSGNRAQGIAVSMECEVPLARGLGSSALYRLAAIASVNALFKSPLTRPEVLELACRLEGHTDNAVACMLGGITISGWEGDRVRYLRHPVPSRFKFVALVPELEVPTEKARELLTGTVSRQDVVFNLQRALWLVHALVHDKPRDLGGAFQDKIHQPLRQQLMSFLYPVISAAESAGAFGAFLSGAGSTIVAVTDSGHEDRVGEAMMKALANERAKGSVHLLKPDNQGLRFIE